MIVPDYIKNLFRHYCSKNDTPRFNGIHLIQEKMTVKLQRHIFIEIIKPKKEKDPNTESTEIAHDSGRVDHEEELKSTAEALNDGQQRISHEKVLLLFPNSPVYLNDQNQQVLRLWKSVRSKESTFHAKEDASFRTVKTDFKAFISTKRGFEAMLSHLAQESRDHVNNLLVELPLYPLSVSLIFRC